MLKSSIWSSFLTLLISAISFLSQVVIAKYYGSGSEMELYLIAASLPTLFSGMIASGFNYALTPELVKMKLNEPGRFSIFSGQLLQNTAFFNFILNLFFGSGVVLFIKKIYPNAGFVLSGQTILIFVLTWCTSFFAILQSLFNCYFNANSQFKFPIAVSIFPYVMAILCNVLFHSYIGILSLVAGLLVGTIISFLISFFCLNQKKTFTFLSEKDSYVFFFLKKIPLVAASMLCFSIYQSIDAFWAPHLGKSNLAYLGYGQRIVIALGALIVAGPFSVIVPQLTSAYEKNELNSFYKKTVSIIKLIIILCFFFIAAITVFSEEIVKTFFERGAFSSTDTISVAKIIPLMLIGMLFMLCSAITFRVIFIKGNLRSAVTYGVLASLVYFILSGVGIIYLKLNGICLAYILTWMSIFILSMKEIFKKNLSYLINKTVLFDLMKALVIAIIIWFSLRYLELSVFNKIIVSLKNQFYSILLIGLSIVLAFVFYLIILIKVFPVSELLIISQTLRLKKKNEH